MSNYRLPFFMLLTCTLCALASMAGAMTAIEQIDPNMATMDPSGKWRWYDARQLTVEGMGWQETNTPFDRLPARAQDTVDKNVWALGAHSAGIAVRFTTNASEIAATWTVSSESLSMPHMPATGVSGLDLYIRQGDQWRWIANGRPQAKTTQQTLATGIPGPFNEFCLYLPLYNGTDALSIGVPPDAKLARAPERGKPVVFYGTSITHGGCASRPGMAYPAILGRRLNVPAINLGFSGNGKMQPPVAALLAEIDPSAYVIDCAPNMTPELINENFAPLVRTLRGAHPNTPIIVVENIVYQAGLALPAPMQSTTTKNDALRRVYWELKSEGVKRLYYLPTDKLLGKDGEATVDGTHPTDLGFIRMADAIEPLLKKALK